MHRRTLFAGVAGVAAAIALPGGTAAAGRGTTGRGTAFPEVIGLPDGWQAEGIATGRGTTFYVGSLAHGGIYRGSLATGKGSTFVEGTAGKQAVGLEYDQRGRLWAATGSGATVYDGDSGRVLAEYALGGSFVNDVVVTGRAAYFTDSYQPVLYEVPLDQAGRLPGQAAVRTIALPGGLGEADGFNNGIEATPDGRLLIVQMLADRLFAFDPRSGVAAQVDLGGASVLQGDGLLRRGAHLYVVRNFFNVIAKFRLGPGLRSATLVKEITHPRFDIPATVAGFGGSLYAVNGRFNLPAPAPTDTYSVVRVPA
ncbi:superoxide dismutase [Dactylosporangium sp. NBC_01737]|uniref:superoxide dismutase n=1 Tax=Dactylosporangium sp. NBC_01737 TaxID=2975959 RepID=UPI002E104FC7|nr:superoxide dismutase [Dactylosporangium sp. NBC_01737]